MLFVITFSPRLPVSKAEKQARRQVCSASFEHLVDPINTKYICPIPDEHHWQLGEEPDQLWGVQL